ncbi:MAG TPA: twin-arginine translocase TatA/TatE family subunit [Bacteroidales bacterium]|nr:twin-arginine translocase TatA/TatE family subunit [Bacteroidales bacterium]
MSLHPILLFLDVSGGELLVIIVVIFLVFGPSKMPEIARQIGKAMNQMKKASNDISREFRNQTSGLTSELTSVQNQIKDEVNKVNREMTSTRDEIRKNFDVGDPSENPEPAVAPSSPAADGNGSTTESPEPLPDVYNRSENAG